MEATMLVKVFNKGQVVIPASIRKKYGIEIGKYVEIKEDKHGLRITPIDEPVEAKDLAGIFSDYKDSVFSEKDIEKATEDYFTESFKNEIY
jgi:AbrB family looped-hinge helix DNA binding protein